MSICTSVSATIAVTTVASPPPQRSPRPRPPPAPGPAAEVLLLHAATAKPATAHTDKISARLNPIGSTTGYERPAAPFTTKTSFDVSLRNTYINFLGVFGARPATLDAAGPRVAGSLALLFEDCGFDLDRYLAIANRIRRLRHGHHFSVLQNYRHRIVQRRPRDGADWDVLTRFERRRPIVLKVEPKPNFAVAEERRRRIDIERHVGHTVHAQLRPD